jgi:surface antigen/LysM repeat protein
MSTPPRACCKCTRRIKIRNSTSQAVNNTAQPLVKAANDTVKTVNKILKRSLFRSKKRVIRYGLIFANIVLVLGVAGFVIYTRNNQATGTSPLLSNSAKEEVSDPLDTISSADIAVHIAQLARLDETVAVVNNADSKDDTLFIVPSDSQIVSKPQIVSTELKSKEDITKHVVAEGETLASIAEKYGVTSDSIKWSNPSAGANLVAGVEIIVPPVDGVVYTIKAGDTPDTLATRFRSDKDKIVAFNDAEISGLVEGDEIVIPGGSVAPPRYSYSSYASAINFRAVYGAGNGYDYGWCTWHAANRRAQTGRPIPTNLGNAITWYSRAAGSGMAVGSAPQEGAVLWHGNLGGLGHVAYVEKINDDGSMLVSDMNYPIWGAVTYRTVAPSEFGSYKFIY